MKAYRYLPVLVTILLLITACSEDTPVGDPNLGSLNPQVYVAIGNSLTAGYQSGALFEEAQMYSYPNLIARQLGVNEFVQPIFPYPGTGDLMILRQITPIPVITNNGQMTTAPTNASHPQPFHNLGIPGAIMADAIDTSSVLQRALSRSNPFYPFILRDQAAFGRSIVEQAIRLQPTLITFWLGANDALGYAASGGTRGTNVGLGGHPPQTLPTESSLFETFLKNALDMIKAGLPNAQVLVATVPDVTINPLFNTVPRKIQNPSNPEQLLDIYFMTNDQQKRVVQSGDYVLLTAQAELVKGIGLHPDNPLPSQYVLDAGELKIAQDAVSAFNAAIQRQVADHGYVLVDVNPLLNRLHTEGISIAGETYSTAYISGGVFSLDGVHLMQRGSALVANHFIETMNNSFDANIRYVSLNDIPGIPAPTGMGKFPAQSLWTPGMRIPSVDIGRIATHW